MTTTPDHPDLAAFAVRCVRAEMRADRLQKQLGELDRAQRKVAENARELKRLLASERIRADNVEVQLRAWQNATGCSSAEEYQARVDESSDCGCPVYGSKRHGREAEELRRGIEALIEIEANPPSTALQELLDRVDASDSLGYLCHVEQESQARIATLEAELKAANGKLIGARMAAAALKDERDAAQARAGALEVELKAADRSAAIYRNQVAGVRALGALPEETFVEFVHRLHSDRDAAQARCAELERAFDSARGQTPAWAIALKVAHEKRGKKINEQAERIAELERELSSEREVSEARKTDAHTWARHVDRIEAENNTLRSQLATITAERDGLLNELDDSARHFKAMSEADEYAKEGYDYASEYMHMLARRHNPSQPTPPSAPDASHADPRTMDHVETAEPTGPAVFTTPQAIDHLSSGDSMHVEGDGWIADYRVRLGELQIRHLAGDWMRSAHTLETLPGHVGESAIWTMGEP